MCRAVQTVLFPARASGNSRAPCHVARFTMRRSSHEIEQFLTHSPINYSSESHSRVRFISLVTSLHCKFSAFFRFERLSAGPAPVQTQLRESLIIQYADFRLPCAQSQDSGSSAETGCLRDGAASL